MTSVASIMKDHLDIQNANLIQQEDRKAPKEI